MLLQDGRVQAAGDLPQFGYDVGQSLRGARPLRCHFLLPGWQPALRGAQPERERDEPLLSPVMKVAFDPAALLVSRCNDPGTGGGECRMGFGVGDCGGGQFGEPGQPRLRASGQRPRTGFHDHEAPQPAFDVDRCADSRADAKRADGIRDRA